MSILKQFIEWFGIGLALGAILYDIITSRKNANLSFDLFGSAATDSLIALMAVILCTIFLLVGYSSLLDKDYFAFFFSAIIILILIVIVGLTSKWFTRWTRRTEHAEKRAINMGRVLALLGILYEILLKLHWI